MVELSEISWRIDFSNRHLASLISEMKSQDQQGYAEDVKAIKAYLVAYFNSHEECDSRLGSSVNPIGSTANGAKRLKVRWKLPGTGKSGGLRLGFLAYCDQRRVVLGYGVQRRDTKDDALLEALGETDARFSRPDDEIG